MSKQEMPTMSDLAKIQNKIFNLPERGNLSDGHHSFNELYYHRMILFSIICNQNKTIKPNSNMICELLEMKNVKNSFVNSKKTLKQPSK